VTAGDDQVGVEIGEDVGMGGGDEGAELVLTCKGAPVVGDDLRQCAIERRREFIGDDPVFRRCGWRWGSGRRLLSRYQSLGDGLSESKAEPLAIAEFLRRAEEELRLGEAALREKAEGFGRRQREGIGDEGCRFREAIQPEGGGVVGTLQLFSRCSQEGRLPGSRRPDKGDELAGGEREVEVLGDDVLLAAEREPEVVADHGGVGGGCARGEVVADGEVHDCGLWVGS
jgi:hypothetical protein